VCSSDRTDKVVPSLIAEKVVAGTLKMCHGGSNVIVRVSNSIGVNNFVVKHILSIVYFTALTDKPMLDQKNIAGGHLGGGGGGGNDGGIDGAAVCSEAETVASWHWGGGPNGGRWGGRLRRWWCVIGVGCGRVFGFGPSNYCTLIIVLCLLCKKKCSAKVLCVVAPGSTFFAPGSTFLLWGADFCSGALFLVWIIPHVPLSYPTQTPLKLGSYLTTSR
jgi:hypothetical protein